MSRLTPQNPDLAQGKTKDLMNAVNKAYGVVPNLFRVVANSPATLEGILNLNGALGQGSLTGQERTAIALAVAEANACSYCLSAHSAIGAGSGMSESQISQARQGEAESPRVAALVQFAKILVKRGGRVSDEEVEVLRQSGLTEGEIVEIVANVSLNIFTNYLNTVADTEVDFPIVQPKALVTA